MSKDGRWFQTESNHHVHQFLLRRLSCDYDGSVSTLDSSQKPPILTGKLNSSLFPLDSQNALPDTIIKAVPRRILLFPSFLTHSCLSPSCSLSFNCFSFFLLVFTLHSPTFVVITQAEKN